MTNAEIILIITVFIFVMTATWIYIMILDRDLNKFKGKIEKEAISILGMAQTLNSDTYRILDKCNAIESAFLYPKESELPAEQLGSILIKNDEGYWQKHQDKQGDIIKWGK